MEDVRVEEESVSSEAAEKAGHISAYTEEAFRMYGGPECEVVLQFDNSLIGVIYDKFGEDTKVIRQSSGTCIATVRIQVSPTFWGWFLQFPGRMKILPPDVLIHDYREWLKKSE